MELSRTAQTEFIICDYAITKAILIGSPGRTDVDLDAQAVPEAHERAGKVPPTGRPHKSWVAIKAHHIGQPVGPQRPYDGRQDGLRRVILARLDQQGSGRAHIEDVQRFDDVLLLPIRVRRHTARILKIQLPAFQRPRAFHRNMLAATAVSDTIMCGQNLPDGACRARQAQPLCQQVLLSVQVVQNRFWTWRALELVGRMVADLQNAVNHERIERRRQVMTS